MSAAASEHSSPEARYAADYAHAFDDFVRSMRGQGFRVSDRVLEGAHDKAERRARELAMARGHRSLGFGALARAGLAQARQRYGY